MPDSKFSKFFRTASPEEKEKVWKEVAKNASEDQKETMKISFTKCPACKKKAFVESVFGKICAKCLYNPKIT